MATQVQLRRGTAAQNDAFTGAQGELSYDTTNKRLRVHDGATAGGFEIKTEDLSGDVLFGDNDKAIFGAGSDLSVYHDGAAGSSHITETGSGSLYVRAENLFLQTTGGATYLQAISGGGTQLRYNNSAKLATTSTGVDITGTLTSDGLTVDGTSGAVIRGSNNAEGEALVIANSSGGTALRAWTQENVGVKFLSSDSASAARDYMFFTGTSSNEVMRITSSGSVGIGTSSPTGVHSSAKVL